MRRVILIQMHVAQQAGTHITAFQQVVAENAILGKAIVQPPLERVHLIDALADKRAFTEHVLVDVRDGTGIRVDARLAAVQARVARAVCACQAHADARLENAVTLAHALQFFVVAGTIQRMRHGSHQFACNVARELRVRVQGDDVLDVQKAGCIAYDAREPFAGRIVGVAAQQGIQVGQLAALAFVAHPDTRLRIPAARTVKEKKQARSPAIFFVQRLDACLRQLQQRPILCQHFFVRIAKIGQQAEIQIAVPIRQKAHFQRLDQVVDVLGIGEHRRYDDQRPRLRGNPCGEIHAWQRLRRHP